ncbi:carboxypeptidase regulatory-like domain-containing protein [Myxococcota bacterium]|nr:carboxypeptidase regulatory-like domain-containing protein [Myxococcota bacterium]
MSWSFVPSVSRPLALGALLALAACGSDKEPVDANGDGIDDGIVVPNNVTVVTPSEPVGWAAGLVTSAASRTPLAGAKVTLFGGGLTGEATTNDRGEFSFGPINAGAQFSVRVEADGYGTATIAGLSVDDAAGNFPTSNGATFVGPIGLVPSDGAFAVQVVSFEGAPVSGASVRIETTYSFTYGGQAREPAVGSATTDVEGNARVTGLPNVRAVPAAGGLSASLVVDVASVDLDGDAIPDLRGETLVLTDDEVRHAGRPPVIVLEAATTTPLRAVASNVRQLAASRSTELSVLGTTDNVRIVFNKPVDRESVIVELSDELGVTTIPAPYVVGALGNTLAIDPSSDLEPGRKYGITVRLQSTASGSPEVYAGAGFFFTNVDPAVPIVFTGRFRDQNADQQWGTGNDAIELTASVPLGRTLGGTPFVVDLWVDLDLNGSGVVGDGTGELPPAGGPLPGALLVGGSEPWTPGGAGFAGFGRYTSPVGISLAIPRAQVQGGFAFEAHPRLTDGTPVTDVSGRPAPERVTGTILLQ